jgi:hypothetical protein
MTYVHGNGGTCPQTIDSMASADVSFGSNGIGFGLVPSALVAHIGFSKIESPIVRSSGGTK